MTTDRQRAANRANAAKSTGPRTPRGKWAMRLNARRHGLAIPVRLEPGADAEIDNLASAIIDEAARPDLVDLAREIAEAEIDLRRIAQARQALAKAPLPTTRVLAVASPNSSPFMAAVRRANRRKHTSLEYLTRVLGKAGMDPNAPHLVEVPSKRPEKAREVGALDRYADRAMSRRKFAVRDFDLALRTALMTFPNVE